MIAPYTYYFCPVCSMAHPFGVPCINILAVQVEEQSCFVCGAKRMMMYTPEGFVCSFCSLDKLDYFFTETKLIRVVEAVKKGYVAVPVEDDVWTVKEYTVNLKHGMSCTCADFKFRGSLCKHILLTILSWCNKDRFNLYRFSIEMLRSDEVMHLRKLLCRYFAFKMQSYIDFKHISENYYVRILLSGY